MATLLAVFPPFFAVLFLAVPVFFESEDFPADLEAGFLGSALITLVPTGSGWVMLTLMGLEAASFMPSATPSARARASISWSCSLEITRPLRTGLGSCSSAGSWAGASSTGSSSGSGSGTSSVTEADSGLTIRGSSSPSSLIVTGDGMGATGAGSSPS